jgi:hypothetical protein
MSDENHQLRQRVSQLESDVRVLRAALAEAQSKAISEEKRAAPADSEENVAPLAKKRGRPAKAKE